MSTPFELDPLPLTGERTVPDIARENYWFRRHQAVYELLTSTHSELLSQRIVLEAGSGEGYGAHLLSQTANAVLALDYDQQAIQHTHRKYPYLTSVRGNLAHLPFRNNSLDLIVNLQVIEHLWDQLGFVKECWRTLRNGGSLVVSTPNRITFSPGLDTPLNPFHTREFAPDELVKLLEDGGFSVTRITGLYHGSRLAKLDAQYEGGLIGAQTEIALSGDPWPDDLLESVSKITTDDFDFHNRDISAVDELEDCLDLLIFGVKK